MWISLKITIKKIIKNENLIYGIRVASTVEALPAWL